MIIMNDINESPYKARIDEIESYLNQKKISSAINLTREIMDDCIVSSHKTEAMHILNEIYRKHGF